MNRTIALWCGVGGAGLVLLPWYGIDSGFWRFRWLADYPDAETAPAILQIFGYGRLWLLPLALVLLAPLIAIRRPKSDPATARLLIVAGAGGLAWMAVQGFAIGLQGWSWAGLEALFGPFGDRQVAMGYGAAAAGTAFLFLLTTGLAYRGILSRDPFVTGCIGLVGALVGLFVFFPVLRVLTSAVQDNAGVFVPALFLDKLLAPSIWRVGCFTGQGACGTAWNSLLLAVAVGLGSTLLGLAFALVVTRTGFRAKRLLRILTVLPIITPPFVIGLAVILLFGRSGAVTGFLDWAFGIPPSRWIYGFYGVFIAQLLAFTPIAFLVLIGVVEGVSPSLEEAAQTLRAGAWRTFVTVSLPLMRPGLANAFLLCFTESLADFGNPMVLGGNFDVLSTSIFFAIVGAAHDQGRAAVLALVLLAMTLAAFYAQHHWLGRKSYATVTGKGDSGVHLPLPRRLRWLTFGAVLPWAALTVVIYVMILFGGFVDAFGRNYDLTLRHYVAAFSIDIGQHGLVWSGAAWNSFWTTLQVSALAAPLTAALGLATAYLLARQRFPGHRAFEFGTMLSFAIPGTVIGISYILAFNTPPIELTGTGIILVICFVFRNMPVGIRAGVAAMAQIDKSLDEASLMLRSSSFATVRRVILPLLRPAIVAALVFSFVRAMTAISAVIFLVSANYDMATSYIIGRVENGDYGLAIAYSSALIVVMVAAILLIQLAVGQRRLGRRGYGEAMPMAGAA
jgi:iron(III) transport system permease protein